MCGSNSRTRCARPGRTALAVALVGLAAVVGGCNRGEVASTPQILRLSQRNEPADLDPAKATLPDDFAILRALLEGLLIPGPAGTAPQPGAAARFDVSADGLTYTFHLRPEATWSDGVPVTAEHFVAAFRRLLTPATGAPKAAVFFGVRHARAFATGAVADFATVGVRAADPHTLAVTLTAPNPRFPYYVASGPWLPVRVDVVEKHGRQWTRAGNFVGNGPFLLAEWRADQRIVARRNPRWHGAAGVRLDEIHFVRFDSGDSEDRAYRAGQIDVTMAVPSSKVEVYARERPTELHRAPMIETRYLAFNTRRPPLNDARVRRALALSVDRTTLVERVLRAGQPAAGRLLPPALRPTPATAGSLPEHGFDPAHARALLAEAAIAPGAMRRLEVSAWSPSQVPALEAMQAIWRRELGIEVTLAVREAKVHLSSLAAGDYDIGFITAIPDVADPRELLGDFMAGAPENYPKWSDPAFDAALARGDADAAERRLLEDVPLTPVYFNTKIWLMSPRVQGWQEDGLWSRCYQQISLRAP